MRRLTERILTWSAPHPEYRPTAEEVVSYALTEGDALALVDPLLPGRAASAGTPCSRRSTSSPRAQHASSC